MSIALIFSLSLFISITLVPFFMKHAVTLGLVDLPDGIRKIHTQVIPRSGGIAIVIATLTPVFIIARLTPELNGLVIGAVIITVFGLLDDRFDLNYKWKFIGQILAILVFILTFGDINKVPFFFGKPDSPLATICFFVCFYARCNKRGQSLGWPRRAGGRHNVAEHFSYRIPSLR